MKVTSKIPFSGDVVEVVDVVLVDDVLVVEVVVVDDVVVVLAQVPQLFL